MWQCSLLFSRSKRQINLRIIVCRVSKLLESGDIMMQSVHLAPSCRQETYSSRLKLSLRFLARQMRRELQLIVQSPVHGPAFALTLTTLWWAELDRLHSMTRAQLLWMFSHVFWGDLYLEFEVTLHHPNVVFCHRFVGSTTAPIDNNCPSFL